MRRFLPIAVIALAAAAPLHASAGPALEEPRTEPDLAEPAMTAPPPAEPEMRLEAVQVEERAAPDEADAAQWPQRGSFWWLVGVIVVAGVILAVLL